MKQPLPSLCLCASALLASITAARGQTPVLAWDAEATAARPAQADVYRGETVALRPAFLERGAPADTNGAAFTLYWQTNGMGAAWWSDPTNAFRWTPARDCGAAAYTLFIRCDTAAGASYRANARLRMLDSPGAEPNALPPPAASLDFARLTVLNPPWPPAADLQAASNALAAAVQPLGPRLDLIEGGTNAWQTAFGWGDHALAGYLLPADLSPYATTQQVAAAVSPLGPRIAALEGGTNAWQTAYGWGDHALAGYLLPADLSPYATTQQVAQAVSPLGPRIAALEGGTNAWQTAYGWGDHAAAGYLLPAAIAPYATTQQVAAAISAIPQPDLSPYATTGHLAQALANAVPYTGATRNVNIGNNDLIVSNAVHVGDDVIVGGHIEVDGRINLLGSNRYIDGLSPIADWSSSRAASAASVSSMVAGEYLPRDADIPGAISMAYWQYIGADMAGLSVGQAFIGETVLFPQGVGFYSDAAALWRASEHYAIPLGPSSPLATQLDVSLSTNAIAQHVAEAIAAIPVPDLSSRVAVQSGHATNLAVSGWLALPQSQPTNLIMRLVASNDVIMAIGVIQ